MTDQDQPPTTFIHGGRERNVALLKQELAGSSTIELPPELQQQYIAIELHAKRIRACPPLSISSSAALLYTNCARQIAQWRYLRRRFPPGALWLYTPAHHASRDENSGE